jgi:hypothetical protein
MQLQSKILTAAIGLLPFESLSSTGRGQQFIVGLSTELEQKYTKINFTCQRVAVPPRFRKQIAPHPTSQPAIVKFESETFFSLAVAFQGLSEA